MTKKKCSFRMPAVKKINGGPFPLFAVDCGCGMRCLGRTESDAEALWLAHMNGEID